MIFGITTHADGCGKSYEWMRPRGDIKRKDIITDNYLDLLLRKELIFDRLVITDFEFEDQPDGTVKYIPVCLKCGRRSVQH